MERREFNKTLLALGALALTSPLAAVSKPGATAYDVSYLWHSDLETALDYREQLAQLLGPDIRRKLRIVRSASGQYGIIYDCDAASRPAAERIARDHSNTLEEAGFQAAAAIKDTDYTELYNILYGKGPDLEAQKTNYAAVSRALGPDLKKRLVIERTPDGEYAIVYKRYGDRPSGMEIIRKHRGELEGTGISVGFIRENNNDLVYGESSFLHETLGEATPAGFVEPTVSDLEKTIEAYIWQLRREGALASDEATSWSVYDFVSKTKLVTINEDIPRQAASMIKPFVALAFFQMAVSGSFIYGPKTRAIMERMIQWSDNAATNSMIDLLGGPKAVDTILRDGFPKIFHQTRIVEKIPLGGRTYRNQASAHDYSRFLYALWKNQLPYSEELKRLMARPNRDRLYDNVPNIPAGTLLYHKTGTTSRLCGDFGILVVEHKDGSIYPYTVVGIIEKRTRARDLSAWIASRGNVIRRVSAMVYDELKGRYNLP